MKLVIRICCLLTLLPAFAATAQEPEAAPGREIVVVDFFLRNRIVPAPYAEALRGYVVQAFVNRNRQEVLDAEMSRAFAESLPGTGLTSPSTVFADLGAFLEMRAPQAIDAGARYLVAGAVADYKFEHAPLPTTDGKRPVQGFKASFRVVVVALDLRLGERLPDQTYELTATARVAEDADRAALSRIAGSLDFYVSTRFKIETSILELCPPDRKGRIRELYIHSGAQTGARQGDLFLVYEEILVRDVLTRRKIGKLRVNDVENPDVAKCKITKGDAEIAAAFASGNAMICISDGKAFGY